MSTATTANEIDPVFSVINLLIMPSQVESQKKEKVAQEAKAKTKPTLPDVRHSERKAEELPATDQNKKVQQNPRPNLTAAQALTQDQKEQICLLLKINTLDLNNESAKNKTEDKINNFLKFIQKHNIKALEPLFNIKTAETTPSLNLDEHFNRLDQKNHYFDKGSNIDWKGQATDLFKKCYEFCEYQSVFQDGQSPKDDQIAQRAYNMLALFGDGTIAGTIKNWEDCLLANSKESSKVTMESLSIPLPTYTVQADQVTGISEGKALNLEQWRKSFCLFGNAALKVFGGNGRFATNYMQRINKEKFAPTTKEELEACKTATYERSLDNPKLAEQYKKINVPEAMFNTAIDYIRSIPPADSTRMEIPEKAHDNIPNVSVKISDQLYMVKLPSNDPRSLVLGHITNCCQSINGHSSECVKDGVTLPNSGFYVFVELSDTQKKQIQKLDAQQKTDKVDPNSPEETKKLNDILTGQDAKIIGQSYGWISKEGNLVLDSLEILTSHRHKLKIQDTFKQFGEVIAQSANIKQINIGSGGQTVDTLRADFEDPTYFISSRDKMIEGTQYYDSLSQYIMSLDRESRAARTCSLGKISESDLYQQDRDKYEALTSMSALRAYNTKKIAVSDLSIYDANEIQKITSSIALAAHINSGISLDILSKFDEGNMTKGILEEYAKTLCNESSGNISYIHTLNPDTIYSLISRDAVEAYKAKLVKVSDLKDYTPQKIKLLTSPEALKAYSSNQISFSDLKNYDSDKIEALLSDSVKSIYNKYGYQINDLKHCNTAQIQALGDICNPQLFSKWDFLQLIYSHKSADDLFKSAVTECATKFCKEEPTQIAAYINQIPSSVLPSLFSENAIAGYQASIFKVSDLKNCTKEVLDVITSYMSRFSLQKKMANLQELASMKSPLEVKQCLVKGWAVNKGKETDVQYINQIPEETIDHLYSAFWVTQYMKYNVKVCDVEALGLNRMQELEKLFGWVGHNPEYKDINPMVCNGSSIEETRKNLLKAYITKKRPGESVEFIDSLSSSNIEMLTLTENVTIIERKNALELLRQGVDPKQLISLYAQSKAKIDALTEDKMLDIYKSGIKLEDLSKVYDTDPHKFNVFKDKYLEIKELCNKGITTLGQLSQIYDQNKDKFTAFTSPIISTLCKDKEEFEALSKIYDQNPEQFKDLITTQKQGVTDSLKAQAAGIGTGLAGLVHDSTTLQQLNEKTHNIQDAALALGAQLQGLVTTANPSTNATTTPQTIKTGHNAGNSVV